MFDRKFDVANNSEQCLYYTNIKDGHNKAYVHFYKSH